MLPFSSLLVRVAHAASFEWCSYIHLSEIVILSLPVVSVFSRSWPSKCGIAASLSELSKDLEILHSHYYFSFYSIFFFTLHYLISSSVTSAVSRKTVKNGMLSVTSAITSSCSKGGNVNSDSSNFFVFSRLYPGYEHFGLRDSVSHLLGSFSGPRVHSYDSQVYSLQTTDGSVCSYVMFVFSALVCCRDGIAGVSLVVGIFL